MRVPIFLTSCLLASLSACGGAPSGTGQTASPSASTISRTTASPPSSPARPSPSSAPAASSSAASIRPASPLPAVGSSWQIQLQGGLDTTVDAAVFEIDGFTTPASSVAALHARGRHVICYLDGGSWEDFRPDAAEFPQSILGEPYQGYPNERWLDIRDQTVLPRILTERLRTQCAGKGFDGVEWDNVEGYANPSGFPLTAADQQRFNTWLAGITHAAGLLVALKNDRQQAGVLAPIYDYAVDEECQQFSECGALRGFLEQGKPVFDVEYDEAAFSCPGPPGVSVILREKVLATGLRRSCR
ncbi:MAG: endo alpha-1,4 polygalactosaminidase [Candidatus Dormibacteraeota bacterium]|uniref:Endo alpha-1,4 polygalactosaminidase n=1 Tax=Candidatus Amunia macphersoniae TaxID=3127014 RepID=A0A934NFR3_9BACT|nr:endo alpha-1,4 polygalactosaminidase [Candidatus Dormibacteraeota bacterium]